MSRFIIPFLGVQLIRGLQTFPSTETAFKQSSFLLLVLEITFSLRCGKDA